MIFSNLDQLLKQALEDHFLRIRRSVEQFKPARLIIDTLSALERIGSRRGLLDFVTAMGGLLREREITTLLTSTPAIRAAAEPTPAAAIEAASVTDVTIRLHYYESGGRNQRSISVMQARGSAHDESIRQVTIDSSGMHIGKAVAELGLEASPGLDTLHDQQGPPNG
jgi:circadian clock protein KaiC